MVLSIFYDNRMTQPEARLIRRAKAYIEGRGGRSFKIHGGDPMQEVGIPDLLVCYRGRFVGLEGKQSGQKPSAKQQQILSEIEEAGGYALAFSTVDEVASLLTKIDKEVRR